MKKIILILLFFPMLLFSQEKRLEQLYQECLYRSLPNKGVRLKEKTKEFERYLIKNRVLADTSATSYYSLFAKILSDKEPRIAYTYSFIDTIKKIDSKNLIISNKFCLDKLRKNKQYKKSRYYLLKKEMDFLFTKAYTIDKITDVISSKFTIDDFKLEFYRLRVLLAIDIN